MLRLTPAKDDQEREATIQEIDALIAESPNLKFVEHATKFQDSWQKGDRVFEYCSSRRSWNVCMGSAGFAIKRDGKTIAQLTCLLNLRS